MTQKKYALVSVSDKNGIIELCKALHKTGYEIVSTGGTYKLLKDSGIHAMEISEFTGDQEILQGRVKTLAMKVHGGILAHRLHHKEEIKNLGLDLITVVVCNFYPFEKNVKEAIDAVSAGEKKEEDVIPELIENIDIGGPTMTWSTIKNHDDGRLVISDPSQYNEVIESLKVYGDAEEVEENFPKDMVKRFAATAAAKTAQYRVAVANFLNSKMFLENKLVIDELPKLFSPEFERIKYDFRYGENPHQSRSAGYRKIGAEVSIFDAELLNEGKVPSYNNIADMNAAMMMMLDFQDEKYRDKRVDIIMKHGNPCGVGVGDEAFNLACETDQISRFGGIYITNRILTMKDVENIGKKYLEVILAPGYEEGVVKALVEADGRRRIFDIKRIIDRFKKDDLMINSVIGGVIVQDYNSGMYDIFDTVTDVKPDEEETGACDLAYRIVKHCNSNAIVLARPNQAIGLGVGQMSRVDSVEIALGKAKAAGFSIDGSVMASDAFFPKADAPMAAIREGVAGIIQPGGSMFDEEVIEMAKKEGRFMIITGMRHFKHNR